MTVARDQRFSRHMPCVICGGHPGLRGEARCWGMYGHDRRYAHCTNPAYAGGLELSDHGAYAHRIEGGDCKCGVRHDPSLPPARRRDAPRRPAAPPPPMGDTLAAIWRATVKDPGRLAAYCRARGLPGEVPPALHFHPALRYQDEDVPAGRDYPAMVAGFQRSDGFLIGLHRTYLDDASEGKAPVAKPKKMLGAVAGAAIRLAQAGPRLALVEGIETGLAVQAATGLPTWACGSATGIRSVELPAFVEAVAIYADHDAHGVGQQAAEEKAARLRAAGVAVEVFVPPAVGRDWLDVYRTEGPGAVRTAKAVVAATTADTPILIGTACVRFMESLVAGRPAAIATPYRALNYFLNGGWRPSKFIGLGGEGGIGKSAFVLECCRAAAQAGHGVLLVSCEMDADEIAGRYLAQTSGVEHAKLERGDITVEERARLAGATNDADGLPLQVDAQTQSLEALEARLDAWSGPPLGLVVVDYLQLLAAPPGIKDRTPQLDALSRGFKRLAHTRRLPIIVLSGFNRDVKPPRGKAPEPTNARIRGTGQLDHDCDIILLLHSPDTTAPTREVDCLITKHRGGRRGRVTLTFEGPTLRFFDQAWLAQAPARPGESA